MLGALRMHVVSVLRVAWSGDALGMFVLTTNLIIKLQPQRQQIATNTLAHTHTHTDTESGPPAFLRR